MKDSTSHEMFISIIRLSFVMLNKIRISNSTPNLSLIQLFFLFLLTDRYCVVTDLQNLMALCSYRSND
jgi:hypothetical protein